MRFSLLILILILNNIVLINGSYYNESKNMFKISELVDCFCDKHPEKDINAHDLDAIKGYPADCCGLCLARSECKAWSWTDWEGGTCYLKHSKGPIRDGKNVILGIVNENFKSCKTPELPPNPLNFVFIIVITALILIMILYFVGARYLSSRYSKITMLKKLEEAESLVPKSGKTLDDKQPHATIRMSQLKMISIIGEGNSANVRLALYRSAFDSLNFTEIAVKTMKTQFCQEIIKKEIEIMKACKHENIVEFIGWAQEGSNNIHIISEFMYGGNLHAYLSDANNRPTIKDCFSYITQILDAMVYLSQAHIVHRDLAARNCLLNSTYDLLKISDFGLSRKTDINYEYVSMNDVKLPFRWLPIEAFSQDSCFTTKGDVWAFGITVWEIFQRGAIPYGNLDMQSMVKLLQSGKRLKKPQYCSDQLYAIMQSCWDENSEARPCFKTLQTQIQAILEKHKKENPDVLNKKYEKPITNADEKMNDN